MPQYYDPTTGEPVYYDPETGEVVNPGASTPPPGPEKSFAGKAGDVVRGGISKVMQPIADALPESVRNYLKDTAFDYAGIPEDANPDTAMQMMTDKLVGQRFLPDTYGANMASPLTLGSGNLEELLELMPALGAVGGSLTSSPGVGTVAGGIAGERGRQVTREFLGQPSATGMIQEYAGLDPDADSTKALNIGVEGVLGLGGVALSKLSEPLKKSARRSTQSLLQLKDQILKKKLANPEGGPKGTVGQKILDRAVEEGVVAPGSTRRTQEQKARKILQETDATRQRLEAKHGQEYLDEGKIDDMLNELEAGMSPGNRGERPGGKAKSRKPIEDAESQIADEMWDFVEANRGKPTGQQIGPTNTRNVKLEDAVTERRTLDHMINRKTGTDVPLQKESQERASNLLRNTINETFPDIGANNLRQSEMIEVSKAVEDALLNVDLTGSPVGTQAAAVGRGAMGYWSGIGALVARALAITTTGPGSSASGAMKRLVSKLTTNPQAIQALARGNQYQNQTPQTEFLDTLEIPEDAETPSRSLMSKPSELLDGS